jgi:hypothetical protein
MNDKLGKGSGMRKKTVKADVWTDETGLEVIGLKIGNKTPVISRGAWQTSWEATTLGEPKRLARRIWKK